ncbi:MAG: hypothetical protein M1828_000137 [Chrysothrix sp. TS-e1954]|nr:MAG: hypothetical protein M1828_000137 [Chrysothrix sp. TS-e1954]
MLTTSLLSRSLGDTTAHGFAQEQEERLLRAIQPAPYTRFDATPQVRDSHGASAGVNEGDDVETPAIAHKTGVNALTVDRFEGRYLLTGGADASIALWDLESAAPANEERPAMVTHRPSGFVPRSDATHKFGITGLSFYPFDSLAFLSSSYDHMLKVYSSETLAPSATFDLSSVVYAHAMSPIADHLLVACATQHPAVRLVDLRSGSAVQSLVGHAGGAVLSVAWHPRKEHILASGGVDGTVRLWDVRRSAGCLGVLDMDDSIGLGGHDGSGRGARRHDRGKAHAGPVNGIVWTEDGKYVVTAGQDERVRVWDTMTGANTLTNFGPVIRNKHLSSLIPALVPKRLVRPGDDVLFYPNEREILMYGMHEGVLQKRLKIPGVQQSGAKNRVTSLFWRAHSIELLSAHTDGSVRSWQPRTSIDAFVEDAEETEATAYTDSRKRKRQTLGEIHTDLTARRVTFM